MRRILAVILIYLSFFAVAQNEPARFYFKTTEGATESKNQIRSFVTAVQRELHYSAGFPLPKEDTPDILVEIGFARPFAMTIGHKLFRQPSGKIQAVIIIPDANVSDWEQLRFAVTAAIFRSELYSRAKRGEKVTEPPEWFIRGLAMNTDRDSRGKYFEQAYGYWSHASLDGASWLFRRNSRANSLPCVAVQLATWCSDKADKNLRWANLLDKLANGEGWTPECIGEVFSDSIFPVDTDNSFDFWMAERTRTIFNPGRTYAGTLSRLRLALLVLPFEVSQETQSNPKGNAYVPLSWYIRNPDTPGSTPLLIERAARFRTAAIGHDREFVQMCQLYAKALETAAQKGWYSASAVWVAAENIRADLETRTASGEILGNKPSQP